MLWCQRGLNGLLALVSQTVCLRLFANYLMMKNGTTGSAGRCKRGPQMTRTLFTNARLLDPAQALDAPGYLLAEDGLITAAGAGSADTTLRKDAEIIDCKGACLAPGLVDMRVQSADPGAEHLEDLHTLPLSH